MILVISEFLLQSNFLDNYSYLYNFNNSARFNSNLSMIILGMKASMGQYASTLPFVYNTFIIYLFLRKKIQTD